MNKNIKKLVEGLFDDDLFDDELEQNIVTKSVYKVTPKSREELYDIIGETIKEKGFDCDLNFIDTSLIRDMSFLFRFFPKFKGNIELWNTSNVTDMSNMFSNCKEFNCDISGWDVSNVTSMSSMFKFCSKFNQNLNNWDVSKVTTMFDMFFCCKNFNGNISDWNVSNVTDFGSMFMSCSEFNSDISNWKLNTEKDINTYNMFYMCNKFNLPIGKWNINKADNLIRMFFNCNLFKLDLSSWDIRPKHYYETFYGTPLREDYFNLFEYFPRHICIEDIVILLANKHHIDKINCDIEYGRSLDAEDVFGKITCIEVNPDFYNMGFEKFTDVYKLHTYFKENEIDIYEYLFFYGTLQDETDALIFPDNDCNLIDFYYIYEFLEKA